MKRKAFAVWNGSIKEGKGELTTDSGALSKTNYSFQMRFEDAPGTNPEELIAAAHAGCFSMALSGNLGRGGLSPERIRTEATVSLERQEAGFSITGVHLDVTAKVPGADDKVFQQIAAESKKGCPVSRALSVEISMDARLEK